MLKLGKLTDYAIAVMAQLARHADSAPDSALSAAALAAETGVPEPTVAKVLKTLARAQLLASVRGVAGGYRLLKSPADITVAEIVEAMDGPIAIVSCVEPSGDASGCSVASRCAVRTKWAPVNDAIRAALADVTLSAMATPSCAADNGGPQVVTLKPYSANQEATHARHK